MKHLTATLAMMASPVLADSAVLDAYVASFETEDPAACTALFAEEARFVDLGRDLSDRTEWFCQAVIDGNGRYEVLNHQTSDDTTTFEMDYRAGGYFVETQGSLKAQNGQMVELIIERR